MATPTDARLFFAHTGEAFPPATSPGLAEVGASVERETAPHEGDGATFHARWK